MSYPSIFSRPFKSVNSTKNAKPTTSPPNFSTNLAQASIVPPVANKSSQINTFCPGFTASLCKCNSAVPYSKSYSTETVSRGNFPFLRAGAKPIPNSYATGHPTINPRASGPTIMSAPLLFA